MDDTYVVQQRLMNTMYFTEDRLEGLRPPDDSNADRFYGYKAVDIQVIQVDWMLHYIDNDDRRPAAIRLLHSIATTKDNDEYFNIPIIQTIIRYFHKKLKKREEAPKRLILNALDLVQILMQVGIMNNVLTEATESYAAAMQADMMDWIDADTILWKDEYEYSPGIVFSDKPFYKFL